MNTSLYQISNELVAVMDELALAEGEVTPEIEAKIQELNTALVEKTDGVVQWVQYNNDLISLAKVRIQELSEFIQGTEKKLDGLDRYVANCLHQMGVPKIDGKLCSITRRKPSQIANVFDETLLPMDFIKIPEQKPMLQKAEIGKALKAGIDVPGARLEESQNISITYKIK